MAVEHRHEAGAAGIAADFVEQPVDRDFTAQRGDGAQVDGELEHPLLASADVATQPDIGLTAGAKGFDQPPVRPARRMVADLERQPRRGGWFRAIETDRHGDPVAATLDGLDRCAILLAERATQAADRGGEHRFRQDAARPAGLGQFVLGDRFAGVIKQSGQHHQRLPCTLR
eukprot:TRINITY_DN9229_c0_g1_i1.p1 TRINITY_DN9229_c0_g1~~TRINITY_DN9229_c0_g1_i1.p1  ORF type:complete len:172 (+),score=31.07 TRINITY_DN9229_c0_g1_i1:265-780(+)